MEQLIFNLNLGEFEKLFNKMGYSKLENKNYYGSDIECINYEKIINDKRYTINFRGTKPFKNKNTYLYATIEIYSGWRNTCDWYPAKLEFINNKLRTVTYKINNEYIKNSDSPNRVTYNEKGEVIVQEWLNDDDQLNRFNGPALIDEQGKHYYLNGKVYNENKYCKFINSIKDNSIIENKVIFDEDIHPLIKKIAIFYNAKEVLEKINSIRVMNKLINNN